MNIKVGDKVRITYYSVVTEIPIGTIGIIRKVASRDCKVGFANNEEWYYEFPHIRKVAYCMDTGTYIPESSHEDWTHNIPSEDKIQPSMDEVEGKKCTCDLMELMREGCKCNGI